MRSRLAVLASGRGSNLTAILDHLAALPGGGSCEVCVVASNRPDAPALDIARGRGVPAESFDAGDDGSELIALLVRHRVDFIALAGYIRKIPPAVIARFPRGIVNVHPALLPSHGGRGMFGSNVHRSVIASGDRETGVTVHLVDNDYDRGPVVAQWRITVNENDDAATLATRVLEVEHILYPRAVELIAALRHTGSA